MGFTGSFSWSGGEWSLSEDPDWSDNPEIPGQSTLTVNVLDSDMAFVAFAGPGGVRGTLVLGRSANDLEGLEQIMPAASVSAYCAWTAQVTGQTPAAASVQGLVAGPGSTNSDAFAEDTVGRLLDVSHVTRPPFLS